MSIAKKITVYFVIMVSGASAMVFEMVAPRLFAPYFGTSTYIWTIVIGVVMASLSLGYFLGGKLADSKPYMPTLMGLFLIAGVFTFIVCIFKDFIIYHAYINGPNFIAVALKTSIIILGPTNFFLGMITPLAVRLLSFDKSKSGRISGNVYAFSTVGSILGTFGSGFWLIPSYGVHNILFGVSIILIFCAVVIATSNLIRILLLLLVVLFYLFYTHNNPKQVFANYFNKISRAQLIADFDTKYSRIWIYDKNTDAINTIRTLTNNQSSMALTNDLEYERNHPSYISYFNLAAFYNVHIKNVLMIGGGAYTYVAYLKNINPQINIDVAEIDPALLGVSEKYFGFTPPAGFHNYSIDGRAFLNGNKKKYDVIFLDAFKNGYAPPFQLTTTQAFRLMHDSLNENGLVVINTVSSIDGKGSGLLKAQFQTLSSVFDKVKVFPVRYQDIYHVQNIVLVAFKGNEVLGNSSLPESEQYLYGLSQREMDIKDYVKSGQILTDDYAPVEYFDFQRIF